MSDPCAKVATDHTMPVRLKFRLERGLHQLSDSSLVEGGLEGAFGLPYGVLCHLLVHMIHFDHGSAKRNSALCLVRLHLA